MPFAVVTFRTFYENIRCVRVERAQYSNNVALRVCTVLCDHWYTDMVFSVFAGCVIEEFSISIRYRT